MSEFFNKETLEIIKKNESKPQKIKNFVTKEFCNELMDYRKSISKKMVDREESTKVPYEFENNYLFLTYVHSNQIVVLMKAYVHVSEMWRIME